MLTASVVFEHAQNFLHDKPQSKQSLPPVIDWMENSDILKNTVSEPAFLFLQPNLYTNNHKKYYMDNPNGEWEFFWADQIAKSIIERKKFQYLDKEVPKFEEYVVKTSASLSGALHIGRLSDTIRCASVYRALKEAGVKAKLIWVAEDMDPFRKVPKGVPKSFEKYLGVPVCNIPDPQGCHSSYVEHHKSEYMEVIDEFVFTKMEKFSTREEYKKGSFNPFIKKLMESVPQLREIQNRYRTTPLKKTWSPWVPICENCGKIVTAQVTGIEENKVNYVCKDYFFETTTASGCGHKGETGFLKGEGKLLWKGEWASEWAFWNVSTEGAGKEYQVPNSAFWVNAEIVEKILDFPAPVPIFYEHLMIDNVKMSASLGNVIYPSQWLEVAPPQLLIYFYNKRLMKTRSFSWKELPQLYDEYDYCGKVYFDKVHVDNENDRKHLKRLYEISNQNRIQQPIEMGFSHAAVLAQIFDDRNRITGSLKKTGQYQEELENEIFDRIEKARVWLEKYAPDEIKFSVQEKVAEIQLSDKQKEAIKILVVDLKEKEWDEKALFNRFYEICKSTGLESKDFFRTGYQVLLNKERGPKLAPFVLALGEKAIELFEEAVRR